MENNCSYTALPKLGFGEAVKKVASFGVLVVCVGYVNRECGFVACS